MEASGWSTSLSSGIVLSLVAVVWTMLWNNLQGLQLQQFVSRHLSRHARRLAAIVDPYLTVTIAEYDGGRMKRSDAYKEVQAYLQRATCATGGGVRHLKAETAKDVDALVLSMGDNEEVADAFRGATVWWLAYSTPPREDNAPSYWGGGRAARADRRFYRLFFLERHRDLVLGEYLPHVRREGRAVMVKNRQRKLFTNLSGDGYDADGMWSESVWSHVVFEHPKTFATLAMDPAKKKEVIDDLDAFRKGKDYYARVGKAWKRGYLLYGPPGTGKSTMIAAMANHLDYDVYDIELTSVRTNTDLRKLFIETTSKSIIVIEDIDCSLDLTRARKKKKANDDGQKNDGDKKDGAEPPDEEKDAGGSKVTLSGVLNFIDGLWSACGGERIIVFTTNHVEKLDPALIRRGRMDKHIEMSYCCFEAFKLLAKVYLDVESHNLFDAVELLLQEANMTPADVAENLTPKSVDDDADSCLAGLVKELEKAKKKVLAKKEGKGKDAADGADDDDDE
ncbi:AAA-ATPase At3g28580-like isoform X1 [Lolium rigidum]|uniref:AAA-ATPase At3g28580-like isoform X1 n=1 Tax=Lolium rigidum TaxID=89674 RepID=UPI001F5C2CA6|nr:AAA-ATPase At3g28580-like isoform X1 [Lolium rigidum]